MKDIEEKLFIIDKKLDLIINEISSMKNYNPKVDEWSPEDLKFLLENYKKMSYREISLALGVNFNRVRSKIVRMKLSKSRDLSRDKELENFILKNYMTMTAYQISEKTGKGYNRVINSISSLRAENILPLKNKKRN